MKELVDLILNRNLDDTLGSRTDSHDKMTRSIDGALKTIRDQELHDHTLRQEQIKTDGLKIKNEKAQLDIEIKKSEAVAKGLSTNIQDPQKVMSEGLFASQLPPRQPATGELLKQELLDKNTNFGKGIIDAVDTKLNELRSAGQRPTDSKKVDQDKWLRDELINTLKKVDTEKHLSLGSFGQAGGIIGGLLDIVSGPLDIGTELFGGTLPSAQKAELITRAISVTSPLVRAEMQDLFNRDRMEQSAEQFLTRRGLGSLRNNVSSGDMEGADMIAKTAIDIRQTLADAVPASFGSEATTGIGEAYNVYENINKLVDMLREATTEEEIKAIESKLVVMDKAMREPIRRYIANGGTSETIHQEIVKSINEVNKEYQKKMPMPIGGDDKTTKFIAMQGVTAQDFVRKLGDFRTAILENIQMDVEEVQRQLSLTRKAEDKTKAEARAKRDKMTGRPQRFPWGPK